MHPLEDLHRTLRVAAMLLDSAAAQIRDAKLLPVKQNIRTVGESLAAIFEIQQLIYRQKPELGLEPRYEVPPEPVRLANRRLGEAMIAADDLAEAGNHKAARELLANFAGEEPSEHHRQLALLQMEHYEDEPDA
jgi:hypothetical protein